MNTLMPLAFIRNILRHSRIFLFLTGLSILCFQTLEASTSTSGTYAHSKKNAIEYTPADEAFLTQSRKLKIAHRKISGLKGISNGYYLVAGVFGSTDNARAFSTKLNGLSLNTQVLHNPLNNLNYVYLGYYPNGLDALKAYVGGINQKYKEKIWILNVENKIPDTPKAAEIAAPKKSKSGTVKSGLDFKSAAKLNKIPTRIVNELSGLSSGYYIIAGVFGDASNSRRLIEKLNKKTFQPRIIEHPTRALQYVSLKKYGQWEKAIADCTTAFSGKYQDKVWILQVPEGNEKTEIPSVTENLEEKLSVSKRKKLSIVKHSSSYNDKLLEKADLYFDKMWYAEAAELYELVLAKDKDNYTYKIIERAGDSHYFNTNMERAFYWYDILYKDFRKEMSAENIFKYAHALKGTGKYARSKRLMRLYERKMKKDGGVTKDDMSKATPREVVLDNILATSGEVEVKNLAINSRYSEFSPMFYKDSELVFASSVDSAFFSTRRYKWNNQPYLDLYRAKINEESQEVRNATKFSKKINTKYHEASVTFSSDNNTMYFTRNNYGKKLKRDKNGVNHLKIYMSAKVDGEWTEAVELPFNSDEYSTGHPALSPDGKQLYFVSDMPGSIGKTDIFVVDVLGPGQFSEPRNLGPEINTERREMFPFINEKKLYFSSDGHVGLGGLDVFEVAYDTEEGFLEVRNLGKPINSRVDDFSYIINEETQQGFFASNRRGGKGDDDIYSFKRMIPEEINENAIAGVVTERVSGDLMPQALVVLLDENNIKLKEMVTEDDGSFLFEDLDSNTKYIVKTVKDEYQEIEVAVNTKENERIEANVELDRLEQLIAIEDGIRKLKTEMIYFDFDKSYIRKDAAEELDQLVAVMKEYETMVIKIESHTDSRGPDVYNKYLSDKRAKSTRAYIISQGIAPERIQSAIGYGEERLLNECDGTVRCSREKHQRNRRSEFIIVNM